MSKIQELKALVGEPLRVRQNKTESKTYVGHFPTAEFPLYLQRAGQKPSTITTKVNWLLKQLDALDKEGRNPFFGSTLVPWQLQNPPKHGERAQTEFVTFYTKKLRAEKTPDNRLSETESIESKVQRELAEAERRCSYLEQQRVAAEQQRLKAQEKIAVLEEIKALEEQVRVRREALQQN
jgi:hypothetical protein